MSDINRINIRKQLSSAKYTDCKATLDDVMSTLSNYNNLKTKLESCDIPDVGRRTLLVLRGTIPVPYRSNKYNIPIVIWIAHDHPQTAPICWLNPTSEMTIKTSRHIDQYGRIYLPYLYEWKPTTNDLLGVIQVMIITFSDSMPLYSKPKGGSIYPQTSSQQQTEQQASTFSINANNPPYPISFNNPTYPGYNNYPAVSPVMATPYPNQPMHPQPPVPVSSQSVTGSSGNLPYSNYGYIPQTLSSTQQSNNSGSSSVNHSSSNFDTIQPKHFRDSLETAVADEIRKNVKEIEGTTNAEIQVLRKTAEDLNNGRKKLDNLIKEIETKLVDLSETKDKIREKDKQIEQQLSKLDSTNDSSNIDECFGPIQPLYKQLISCFVEENAIVDTIYHLNHALQRGVIDINIFIKHVKELSRRQFMMRALIKKCREKARLPA